MAVMLEILANLVELSIVALTGHPRYFHCRDAKKSVAESFRHVRPLRILSIEDSAATDQPAFLTVDMLQAIGKTHDHTLRTFCTSSVSQLDSAVMVQLAETVRTMSENQNPALTWPGIEAEFLDCLPSSTWSLKFACL